MGTVTSVATYANPDPAAWPPRSSRAVRKASRLMWWKLGALGVVTTVVLFVLLAPMMTVTVRMKLPPGASANVGQIQTDAGVTIWAIEAVLVGAVLMIAAPRSLLVWFLAGGLFYMGGTIFFYYDNRIRYFHAAWHAMVIAGSACHFVGILKYCTLGR